MLIPCINSECNEVVNIKNKHHRWTCKCGLELLYIKDIGTYKWRQGWGDEMENIPLDFNNDAWVTVEDTITFDITSSKKMKNKETGNECYIFNKPILNCTNGQQMILYGEGDRVYIREEHELYEKFEDIE